MQFFHEIKKTLFFIAYILFVFCGLYACASIGNPSGGDYDLEPPRLISSNPAPEALRFEGNKIELMFDEYISIEKPSEKVIISPPQQKAPEIRALGKKISIELKDSLIPNTTYTFDFTDGIVDNNEKNAIEGFSFAFSTGDVVDSLVVSGLLLNAENLEPMPNVMIGIHSNLSDSAFVSLPFLRTSQTNDKGQFWIRNVAPGSYHVFALGDMNRDYKFDQPAEAIAFDTLLIMPSFEPAVRTDTIWKDSLTIDTLREVHFTRFTPDDVQLFLFNEDFEVQYFQKGERINDKQFTLSFNAEENLPPQIRLLEPEIDGDWYVEEWAPDKKSLTYWIQDSLIYQRDTLGIQMTYQAHDTLFNWETIRDTLQLVLRNKAPQKKKKNEEESDIEYMEIQVTPSGMIDVYDTLKLTFSEPLLNFDPINAIHIEQKVDTLWEKRDFPILQDSLNPRVFYVDKRWSYNEDFQIYVDSAAVYSMYGKPNKQISTKFKTRKEEDYGHLYVMITGISGPGIGQLLNSSDVVVKESILNDSELIFENIKPGKYYLRYIDDVNENGKWDTGNYAEKRQPESVYYFPSFFEIRQYSEIEHTWNVMEVEREKQKPLEITKNKPVVKKIKKDERANSNQQRNSNLSSSGMPGF